ncbi:MAG: hypothetical protein A7315_09325 [Candidatus Altiarchaeales archaeon WOR_SM1_79]|nr:MAG: hypothetical protein A7315_09325 [Candidatus Altiarchaeales archaeon WOR_SM1_79]
MEIHVLDTSAILHSALDFPDSEDVKYLITNSVLREIRDENIKAVVRAAVRDKRIRVEGPGKEAIKKVLEKAKDTGDIQSLSGTDADVIALALEKNGTLVSDDYAIQNVATALGINYERIAQEGIKKKLTWIYVCAGCGRKYPVMKRRCDVCGLGLRKVVER